MAKSSGTTRSSSSGAPRGLNRGAINGWNVTTDSWGNPTLRAKGADAEVIYNMLSTPVERLVEERTGNIRSGGGWSGNRAQGDAEFAIIFQDGTSRAQMREYMDGMSVGAKLLNNFYESHSDADRRAYNDWAEEYRLRTRRMNHPEEFE